MDLDPHCVVETRPGRFHCWWFLEPCSPTADDFSEVLRALAANLGGDPDFAKAGVTAVMRLPGYPNLKKEPHLARVVRVPSKGWRRLRWRDARRLAGLEDEHVPRQRGGRSSGDERPPATAEVVGRALSGLDPRDFSSRGEWFRVMAAAYHASAGQAEEEFLDWCSRDPAYRSCRPQNRYQWRSLAAGSAGDPITAGTLVALLRERGRDDLADLLAFSWTLSTPGLDVPAPPHVVELAAEGEDPPPPDEPRTAGRSAMEEAALRLTEELLS